jgi:DnaJ-class molecular chaperone
MSNYPHGPSKDFQKPGSPTLEHEPDGPCKNCDGDGVVPEWDDEMGINTYVECPVCEGEGEL